MKDVKKKLKILIVDDEPLIRRAFKLAGESRGHKVKSAENGKEALALWTEFNPDLAFIDMFMPEMNGLELLKNIPSNSKTKKIVISAHDQLNEKEIVQKGVDRFIKKPFENIYQIIEEGEKLTESP